MWLKILGALMLFGLIVQYWYVFVPLAVLGGIGYLVWRYQRSGPRGGTRP